MKRRDAAVCIVTKGNMILMLRRQSGCRVHCALPGGEVCPGEAPENAALRALCGQCGVDGKIIRKLAEYHYPMGDGAAIHSFHTAIAGGDAPLCGDACWMTLGQLCERDRIFLWSAGLAGVPYFFGELLHGAIDE